MTALIACSHGTNDEEGRIAIRALVEQARAALPGTQIAQAFVDVESPDLVDVLKDVTAKQGAVVVPLLLSTGYHTNVDITRAVAAHHRASQAPPLGTHPLVAEVVLDRLLAALPEGWRRGDHVVLAAAGSSNPAAVADVEVVADRLRQAVPVPVTIGYASANTPRIAEAVTAARGNGAERVIVASYVLAPGYFAGLVRQAGGDVVSLPLAPDERLAAVIADRFTTVLRSR
ncbi:hypothetical protein GCM10010401_21650 [Rarobacter faecitabidus]|uniref:Sirohydrochlorin ferrochelatase n=1 Tax=Rarobacter faecitabidus TaxID=13243 RepID=A0A542ZVN8_RARFA|nr:CbiX/SirB N-terminal domain-containing protein [Rarobacter faecitabidus]TQL64369.1 sirohydrochlorin ferrochelatase [Rarobacter faecitabidus]